MVTTRQPRVAAACTAKPPQPVPISSTRSSGPSWRRLADPLELGHRRLLERHPRVLEQRAGVHHRRVEHPLEQLRCRGRSARRCRAGCAAGCAGCERLADALARLPQRCRDGAGRGRSATALRAARRMTATRSGESHMPWAYDSASPRLPRMSIRQKPGIVDVDRGGRGAGRRTVRRASPSTMVKLPTRIARRSSDATVRQRPASRSVTAPAVPGWGCTRAPWSLSATRVSVDERQHPRAWRAGGARSSAPPRRGSSSRRRRASVASNTAAPSRRLSMWTESVGPGVRGPRVVDVVHAHERRDVQLLGEAAPQQRSSPARGLRAGTSGARPTACW